MCKTCCCCLPHAVTFCLAGIHLLKMYSFATQDGGVVYNNKGVLTFVSSAIAYSTAGDLGGGVFGFGTYTNCTIKFNSAVDSGGAVYGSATFWDSRLIGNYAATGGAVHAIATTTITRCVFSEGGASQQGAAMYSEGANIEVRESLAQQFSAADSGGATAIFYADLAVAAFDRVTWLDNEIATLVTTARASLILRNCEGLTTADVQGVSVLMGCGDAAVAEYCSPDYCSDVPIGIDCYCHPDGVKADPLETSCASSPQLDIRQVDFDFMADKRDGVGRVTLQFANAGDLWLQWNLTMIGSGMNVPWMVTPTTGFLGGCELGTVDIALPTRNLTARADAYRLQLILSSNSYQGGSHNISVRALVSADPDASKSVVDITTDLAQLTAAGMVAFTIKSIDATTMLIRDTASVLYVAELRASPADSTTGTCIIRHDAVIDRHFGECALPDLVAGAFELAVRLGSELVGGGSYNITVEHCPDSFVLVDGGSLCTCPAGGRFALGSSACVACPENHAKPESGTEKADCAACLAVLGETSNSEHTACDACIAGYYSKANACVQCPKHPMPCVESSALMPGYWRAAGEGTEVLECGFGVLSCPSAAGQDKTTGRDQYCAPQYVGPLCSVCASSHFLTSRNECSPCNRSGPWLPTAITGTVFVICIALVAGALARTGVKAKAAHAYKIGKTKGLALVQVFQGKLEGGAPVSLPNASLMLIPATCRRVVSQFSSINSHTGDGRSYAEPAATFARVLAVSNFDVVSVLPLACSLPSAADFYTQLALKTTVLPLGPVTLLWVYASCAKPAKRRKARQTAARLSLLWAEMVLTTGECRAHAI